MDLTISRPALHEHIAQYRMLWHDCDGPLYWAVDRDDTWDKHVCDPECLLVLAPKDGAETTIRIELLPITADTDHAAAVWLDPAVDVVVMARRRDTRTYGCLERGGFRRRLDKPRTWAGMVGPAADGRWIVWETEDDQPIILDDWAEVVLTVGA